MLRKGASWFGVALLAFVCGAALTPPRQGVASPAVEDPWVNSLQSAARVRGPVQTVTLEDAELSTDGSQRTLSRHPQVKFHYDQSGRLAKSEYLTDGGGPSTFTVYSYDDEGRLQREAHLNILHGETSETRYRYDDEGRPVEQTQVDAADGTVLAKRVFTYNEGDGSTEIVSYRGKKLQARLSVLRDARGLIVETGHTAFGPDERADSSVAGRAVISYDAMGNIKTERLFDSGGRLVEEAAHTYEYDAYQNWVKRVKEIKIVGEKGDVSPRREVVYRNITYN